MSGAMMNLVEGTHMGFLRKITGKRTSQKADRVWDTPASEEEPREAGTQLADKYIGLRQATVAQWVTL